MYSIPPIRPSRTKEEPNQNSISSLSFAFLFKQIFSSLPPPLKLPTIQLTPNEVRTLFNCCFLSKMIYLSPENRPFPKSLNHVAYESTRSELYRIPYFIVDSPELNTIFVTCRGSYCFADFIVDIKASAEDYAGGKVHQGVYLTAKNIYEEITSKVLSLYAEHKKHKRKIMFTGHSLGASVSALINETFRTFHPEFDSQCFIFAPCAAFSEDLWVKCLPHTISYVLEGDFVPFLSFTTFYELPKGSLPSFFKKYLEDAIVQRMERKIYRPKLIPAGVNPFDSPPPPLESILNDDIDKIIKPTPLYPPGNCYLVSLVDEKNSKLVIKKVKDYHYFARFHNDLNEFRHMMGIYREWIEKFVSDYFKAHPNEKLHNY